jgi:predicted O-methyltransferase YrrM
MNFDLLIAYYKYVFMERIFVQIASYRDAELVPTIKHCLARAKYPERISFGVCRQHDPEEEVDDILKQENVKIIDVPYYESKGACWARHNAQKLYSGQEYSLQIDSHHRFIVDWDEEIINIWKSLNDKKAIITGYPPNYNPNMEEKDWYKVPQICNVYRFEHAYVGARPANMPDWENKEKPVKGVFISAGFIFGPGEINVTVPYDPEFYFSGEECAMALRYFTNGYNIYNSHRVIVYHYYQRLECKKHWSDHTEWPEYHRIAHGRLDCLLGRNKDYDLSVYGLGAVRTIEDYKNYAGIDFVNRIVHKDTGDMIEPPCSNSKEGWDNEIVQFKEVLFWDNKKVAKCDDPRYWSFIIMDQDGVAIHREDVLYTQEKEILDGRVCYKLFTFDRSKNRQIPTNLLIWPYSESKGWLNNVYLPILTSPPEEVDKKDIYTEIKRELFEEKNIYEAFDNKPGDTGYPHTNLLTNCIQAVVDLVRPKFWLEIGSMLGGSAIMTAKYFKKYKVDCKVICIDPFCGDVNMWCWEKDLKKKEAWCFLGLESGFPTIRERFMANVLNASCDGLILPIQATGLIGIELIKRLYHEDRITSMPNIIYLDSAHQEDETYLELERAWNILEPGGILFGDDWSWASVRNDVLKFSEKIKVNEDNIIELQKLLKSSTRDKNVIVHSYQWFLCK